MLLSAEADLWFSCLIKPACVWWTGLWIDWIDSFDSLSCVRQQDSVRWGTESCWCCWCLFPQSCWTLFQEMRVRAAWASSRRSWSAEDAVELCEGWSGVSVTPGIKTKLHNWAKSPVRPIRAEHFSLWSWSSVAVGRLSLSPTDMEVCDSSESSSSYFHFPWSVVISTLIILYCPDEEPQTLYFFFFSFFPFL